MPDLCFYNEKLFQKALFLNKCDGFTLGDTFALVGSGLNNLARPERIDGFHAVLAVDGAEQVAFFVDLAWGRSDALVLEIDFP